MFWSNMILFFCFGGLLVGPVWAETEVYFMANAESAGDSPDDRLSSIGLERGQCIASNFVTSALKIRHIMSPMNSTASVASPSFGY
jgi:hypothetical protein